MKPPKGVQTMENTASVMWFDEEGNLCSYFKPGRPPSTIEEAKKNFEGFKEIAAGRKLNFIIDIDNAPPSRKDVRDYTAENLGQYVNAFAMVGSKPMTRMMVNIFFGLKKPPYPSQIFSNEDKARQWLRQFPIHERSATEN